MAVIYPENARDASAITRSAACMVTASGDAPDWEGFHRRIERCTPPQRPHPETSAIVQELVAQKSGRVLLFGMTPELVTVAPSIVAVDWSASAIARIWPGSSGGRRAIRGDWLDLPCAPDSFSSAIGDGCLNCLDYPDQYSSFFQEMTRVVRPGGRIVLRTVVTPDGCERLDATRALTLGGGVGSVSALKWRLATGLCAERRAPNLAVRSIADVFDRLFPDRAALYAATGWSSADLEAVDAYRSVVGTYSFPTLAEIMVLVPLGLNASVAQSGTYELAERCPLLVIDVPP